MKQIQHVNFVRGMSFPDDWKIVEAKTVRLSGKVVVDATRDVKSASTRYVAIQIDMTWT